MMAARASVDVLGLPNCTTCQRTLRDLRADGLEVRRFRDLKHAPLDRSELRQIAARVGGVEKLFSRRARKYREMGLAGRTIAPDEMEELMLDACPFIVRPVVLAVGRPEAFCGAAACARRAWRAAFTARPSQAGGGGAEGRAPRPGRRGRP